MLCLDNDGNVLKLKLIIRLLKYEISNIDIL